MPETFSLTEERIPSGVPGLDDLLGGGLWRGSTTLLSGVAGAGKTTIGLQFVMEGIAQSERSLYVNFQENPTHLARAFRNLGVDLEAAKSNGLGRMYTSPVELQVDSLIVTMFRRIKAERVRRVVIDAVGDLVTATSDPQRLYDYLYALIQHFTVQGVTTLLVYESGTAQSAATHITAVGGRYAYMADNIVHLGADVVGELKRTVTVLKARGTAHDLSTHELQITGRGASVR